MKKQVAGLSFIAIAISIVLCSYREGPASSHGWDCTGAETDFSNPTGCTSGGGCHASSATAGITVALEMDSAGSPVTSYVGGKSYTVKLTGTNTTTNLLPGFGFQIGSITGSTAQATPTNAGTWGTLPATSQFVAPQSGNFVLNVVEHSNTTAATSGGGAQGSTYVRVISWTAPVAGTGPVSFWAALNAVNENGVADTGDHWNVHHLEIDEEDSVATPPNGIISVVENDNIKVYPNPVNDVLNLQCGNLQDGNYTVSVYNISGQMVVSEKMEFGVVTANMGIITSTWESGIYLVKIEGKNSRQVFKVVKQ